MNIDYVSFNLRCCDDPDGNSIAERAPRLDAILAPSDSDVIAFQEIRPKWVPEINRYFSLKYDMFLCYRSVEKPEGLVTLWKKDRFSCVEQGHFWFSDTPEMESLGWDEKYHCPRICSYCVLKELSSEEAFLVMNTHFGFGDNGQMKSVNLINSYRKRFSELKTILSGDFNMLPNSPAHLELQKIFTDVNEVTARDRRATYHAYAPSPDQISHIDYIFTTEDIVPKSFRILDEAVQGKFPSDHFGIYSQLFL